MGEGVECGVHSPPMDCWIGTQSWHSVGMDMGGEHSQEHGTLITNNPGSSFCKWHIGV